MQARLAEHEVIEGVSLVRAVAMKNDFRRHSHRSILLGVIRRGWRRVCLADQEWTVAAGSGFILPAGCVHRCVLSEDHHYRVASIRPERWEGLLGQVPMHAQLIASGSEALLALRKLIAGVRSDPRDLVFESHLLALHESLSRAAPGGETERPLSARMHHLRAWLERHCAEPVRLATLAEVAACSPARVNRLFSQTFGLPPHEYLMQHRLGLAARRLRGGGDALVTIAADLGFADQSHFQRFFKRAFGVAPGAYREASRRVSPVPD